MATLRTHLDLPIVDTQPLARGARGWNGLRKFSAASPRVGWSVWMDRISAAAVLESSPGWRARWGDEPTTARIHLARAKTSASSTPSTKRDARRSATDGRGKLFCLLPTKRDAIRTATRGRNGFSSFAQARPSLIDGLLPLPFLALSIAASDPRRTRTSTFGRPSRVSGRVPRRWIDCLVGRAPCPPKSR